MLSGERDGELKLQHACAQVSYLHHRELAAPVPRRSNEKVAYYRIAAHYRFILKTFFDCFKYPRLIILEARSCLLRQLLTAKK